MQRGYSSLCSRLGYCCRGSGDVPTLIESGKYACPGSKLPVTCPKGYFCPTADTKTICPKGSYCQSGSTEPKTCPVSCYIFYVLSDRFICYYGILYLMEKLNLNGTLPANVSCRPIGFFCPVHLLFSPVCIQRWLFQPFE